MNKLIVIILSLILLAGCTPSTTGHFSEVYNYQGRFTIFFPKGIDKPDRDLVKESCRRQLHAFENNFGQKVTPVGVHLTLVEHFICGRHGHKATGCYYIGKGIMKIVAGKYFHAPAFYHELVHHMLPGHDPEHRDAGWIALWIPQYTKLIRKIIEERK